MPAATQFKEGMKSSDLFASPWESLPSEPRLCAHQALLTKEGFHTAIVERYRPEDDSFVLRVGALGKTTTCPRIKISEEYVGLIPNWAMVGIKIEHTTADGRLVESGVANAPSDVFNRWFHVYLRGEPLKTTPSQEYTTFERRIILSAWMRHHPDFEIKLKYSLSHGNPTLPRS